MAPSSDYGPLCARSHQNVRGITEGFEVPPTCKRSIGDRIQDIKEQELTENYYSVRGSMKAKVFNILGLKSDENTYSLSTVSDKNFAGVVNPTVASQDETDIHPVAIGLL